MNFTEFKVPPPGVGLTTFMDVEPVPAVVIAARLTRTLNRVGVTEDRIRIVLPNTTVGYKTVHTARMGKNGLDCGSIYMGCSPSPRLIAMDLALTLPVALTD